MKKITTLLLTLGLMATGCADEDSLPGGSGLMESTESIISAETSGRVLDMYVDEGSTVDDGDTLVLIDTTRADLQLKAARAGLEAARAQRRAAVTEKKQATEQLSFASTELARIEKLKASGTATQQQLDRVQHEHSQAEIAVQAADARIGTIDAEINRLIAEIDRLEQHLIDCRPTAPMSGVVTDRFVETGELLAPGRPIIKIARLDTMEVKIYMPTGQFASVAVGDSATIDTESGGDVYDGRVVWTSEEAEFTPKNVQTAKTRANLVFAVKVKVPNRDGTLKIGMPVYVTLHTK